MTNPAPEPPPWHDCETDKPANYAPVIIMLSDGAERLGFWSGNSWVAAGAEVRPDLWRPRQQN
jgi:hypothetical protein